MSKENQEKHDDQKNPSFSLPFTFLGGAVAYRNQ